LTPKNLLVCTSETYEAPEAYLLHTAGVHWVRLDWLPQLEHFICNSQQDASALSDMLPSTSMTRLISRYSDEHDQDSSAVQGLAICADVVVGHYAIALIRNTLIIQPLDVLPSVLKSSTTFEQLSDLQADGLPTLTSPLTLLLVGAT
jgi:hypothetical protein